MADARFVKRRLMLLMLKLAIFICSATQAAWVLTFGVAPQPPPNSSSGYELDMVSSCFFADQQFGTPRSLVAIRYMSLCIKMLI